MVVHLMDEGIQLDEHSRLSLQNGMVFEIQRRRFLWTIK